MKTVRFNTFETNSSSCHSVTYVRDVENPTIDTRWSLSANGSGEYGWSGRVSTPEEKLDYYLVSESYNYKTKEEYEDFLNKLRSAFKSRDCVLEIEPAYDDSEWRDNLLKGYIDHQSLGELEFDSLDEVVDWVFTNGTGVLCLNDNESYEEQAEDPDFWDLHY